MKIFSILLLTLILSCSQNSKQYKHTHYSFDLIINPKARFIESNLNLTYINKHEDTDSLEFLLHKNLHIESLTSDLIESFVFDTLGNSPYRYSPEAAVLKLKLFRSLNTDEKINIRMRYSGKIGIVSVWEVNRISENWVELGKYTPWFPYNPDIEKFSFDGKVTIDSGYQIEGNGNIQKIHDYWLLKNEGLVSDIIITASRNFKVKKTELNNFTLKVNDAVGLADSTISVVSESGSEILQLYRNWFGIPENQILSVIIAPREKGGGYARKGILLLSSFSDEGYQQSRVGYTRFFAHEFAHLWWSNAASNSWEDWLNESFAEYSAMLILREFYGQEEFQSRLKKKAEGIEKLPPIRDMDRDNKNAYRVLYDKGPILLYELENQIGKDEFIKLMHFAFSEKISTTSDFLKMIRLKEGDETAKYVEQKLNH